MKFSAVLIFVFWLTAAGTALAQDRDPVDFVMNSRWEFRGKTYEYAFNSEDLKNTPAWDPMKGEPPLLISEALRIARSNTSIFIADARGWEATSIRLTSTSRGKWYYFVTFSCMDPSCVDGPERGFNILVKLDGTVLRPKMIGPQAKN
jgi:hypothetical protein